MQVASNDESESIQHISHCPLEEVYRELGTSSGGLSDGEARARLGVYGENILPRRRKKPWQSVVVQFKNLFNILLLVAAGLSFVSGITGNDPGSINMGIVILIVVAISIIFSLFQEHRAERAVQAIRELIPMNSKVRRGGEPKLIPALEVVPGDILLLEAGDKVSADARVISSFEMSVDNSPLTGESEPQPRLALHSPGPPKELLACMNLVFAGTTISSGSGEAVVIAIGTKTEFGRVVSLTQTIKEPLSPLQIELNRTARLNFIVAVTVGMAFLLVELFVLHLQFSTSLLFMIGVMVSLVPEGFQVTLTLALALSSLAMSKKNVVVKRLSSVETLGSATVICTDKTGTVTEGQMTVKAAWIGGMTYDVTGEGYEPEGSMMLNGSRVMARDREDLSSLCDVAALDNTATVVPPLDRRKSRWTAVGDSTEAALLVMATKAGVNSKDAQADRPRIGMIPFDSGRKMMTSVHQASEGKVVAYTKGASSEILSRSSSIYWNGEVTNLTEPLADKVRVQADSYAREAYRVLALAVRNLPAEPLKYTSEEIETGLTFVGLVAILDPPRAESAEAVRQARDAGVRVIMMTGDHELTAEAIARKVGMITTPKNEVITGRVLSEMSDSDLDNKLNGLELVFARISPDQKLRIVQSLRKKGELVAVTGDGVNDAPSLLEADIGIAMGISGTDVARESADMVLLDDNFASIVMGMEQGRCVYDNLKKFIIYVFTHNWAELISFIVFVLLGTPLPLTVLMILAIDLIMEIPPSLALTLEPPEPGIMDRPPRKKAERLFNMGALARSAYIGIVIGIISILWCFDAWSKGGWSLGMGSVPDQTFYQMGTTLTMAAIMAGQLGTILATRTNISSVLHLSPLKNKWLVLGILASIAALLSIIYLPAFHALFSTSAFDLTTLALLYLTAVLVFGLEEIRKLILRTYIIPVKPVIAKPVLAPLALATREARAQVKVRPPFVERASPVMLPISVNDWSKSAVQMAINISYHAGSPLLILRMVNERTEDAMISQLESEVASAAAPVGVPYEFIELKIVGKQHGASTVASSLREAAKRAKPSCVLLPVDAGIYEGRQASLHLISWIAELAESRVYLLSNWEKRQPDMVSPRILIPVLEEFDCEPFELAEALTEGANIPDINVVAAKVVEIPSIVPLYSIYKPESLVNADKQLETYRSLPRRVFIRRIRPIVLLVRETSRDLLDFATQRDVDMIILQGNWEEGRGGFLGKKQRVLARNANCLVVVTLPKRSMTECILK